MSNAENNPSDDGSPQPASAGGKQARHELVLVKNGRRYVFSCAPGQEAALLAHLREMADDPAVDLSWFDAAVLSHQVGHRLGQRLARVQQR